MWKDGQVRYNKHFFKVWDSYGLSQYAFRSGAFSEDARGRWYFNVVVQVEVAPHDSTSAIGIDLGLKTTATCSDGTVLERQQRYRNLEVKLGKAQRGQWCLQKSTKRTVPRRVRVAESFPPTVRKVGQVLE